MCVCVCPCVKTFTVARKIISDTYLFGLVSGSKYGKTQLGTLHRELLHNAGEWKAKEESTASQPREPSTSFQVKTETQKDKQLTKSQ